MPVEKKTRYSQQCRSSAAQSGQSKSERQSMATRFAMLRRGQASPEAVSCYPAPGRSRCNPTMPVRAGQHQ